MIAWLFLACTNSADAGDHFVLHGAKIGDVVTDVEVDQGLIVAVGDVADRGVKVIDVSGKWLSPAWIDSHVHLAYLAGPEILADGGIAGVVDLAAPLDRLGDDGPLHRIYSGPMLTAVRGYPTQSWGSDGYGLECADAPAAAAGVTTVADAGAKIVKVALSGTSTLDDAQLRAIVDAAHARGLKVVAHALKDSEAARAAAAGVDGLAHTPTEPLADTTLAAWSGSSHFVISTLAAFGGGSGAVTNLARLHAAGTVVLYGTDYGNGRTPGIDRQELSLLKDAGFSPDEIAAAGTAVPATFWGFSDLGSLEPGHAASLLVLDADPRLTPSTLASPRDVFIDGVRR